MTKERSFWRKFNPSIKEMMEKNPDYSVLGLWWSSTWRIFVIEAVVMAAFFILAIVFSIAAIFHQ